MSVLIRRLAEGDCVAELTAMLHAAYARLGAQGFNCTAVDQTEDVTRRRMEDGECYVAMVDGKIVGTILFHEAGKTDGGAPWYERGDVATIHQFGVLPGFQTRGIGSMLVTFVEKRAVETGAAEIALDTVEKVAPLTRWYMQRGYRQVGHAQWRGKTYRSVILSKALNATGGERAALEMPVTAKPPIGYHG